jgi:hypothetical protein
VAQKPALHLIGSPNDPPTPEEIFVLAETLTGQKPTPDERAEVQARYDAKRQQS